MALLLCWPLARLPPTKRTFFAFFFLRFFFLRGFWCFFHFCFFCFLRISTQAGALLALFVFTLITLDGRQRGLLLRLLLLLLFLLLRLLRLLRLLGLRLLRGLLGLRNFVWV